MAGPIPGMQGRCRSFYHRRAGNDPKAGGRSAKTRFLPGIMLVAPLLQVEPKSIGVHDGALQLRHIK